MTLCKGFYKGLEDIVGPDNVSDNIGIIDSYALSWEFNRFLAVVLPKSTVEVQAVIKLCNKNKVGFKASSTGWGIWNEADTDNVIKLDLKRMNQIVEINEESGYAVVESYVITAQLQAELMKRGYNMNVAGCGGNASAMPFTAHAGVGHMGETTSYRERNILGVEWVTPAGEIVRLGSLGSGDEWFCGDGPGPSLRGILCGSVAPLGGMGVFTRAAMKIYPWVGPAEWKIEGISPHYLPPEMPANFHYAYYSFPSVVDMCEAQRKIGESEIAFQIMGFNVAMVAANMATNNIEDNQYLDELRKQIQGRGFQVVLAGTSPSDFAYKKKALEQIMKENNGKTLKPLDDPIIGAGFIWRCTRITASIRECFRLRGRTQHSAFLGGSQMFHKEVRYMEKLSELKQKLTDEGLVRDDTAGYIAWTHETGHLGHGEMLFQLTDSSKETLTKTRDVLREAGANLALTFYHGVPSQAGGNKEHDRFGPHAWNYQSWMRKVKNAFDPEGLSDSMLYISAKE